MAVFKCKMCGGDLELTPNATVVECPYCETKQTLPKLDTDRKLSLYERANHFRRNNEFDKAMAVYEMILNEDDTDSEAYWSIVLCRYGIEYVKDPLTYKRLPTVNRTQYTSIFSDKDYLKAIELANEYQRSILKKEAEQIDYIQKSILEISSKEEPFDIFICYKETGIDGQRTQDSVYAQDIYDKLTEEGYKVFFSRITLEDKIGTAYEPYIFAALNSAKVMLVIGTQKEYYNAVWVKNEWSRYIALIKQGEKKNIIPLYKDIDPYELPVEFSYLQSVNMNTVGFMQDLVRGINKLIRPTKNENNNEDFESKIVRTSIEKAYESISKCDYENADLSLNTAKGYDPTNPLIYVGKILISNKIPDKEKLVTLMKPLEEDENYKLALKYADINLSEELEEYNKVTLYNYANTLKKKPKKAIKIFERLGDYKDSKDKILKNKKKIRNKNIILTILLIFITAIIVHISNIVKVGSPHISKIDQDKIIADVNEIFGEPFRDSRNLFKKNTFFYYTVNLYGLDGIFEVRTDGNVNKTLWIYELKEGKNIYDYPEFVEKLKTFAFVQSLDFEVVSEIDNEIENNEWIVTFRNSHGYFALGVKNVNKDFVSGNDKKSKVIYIERLFTDE